MAEQAEKTFVDGCISKRNENAPDFVVVNQSFKVDEFITFLKANAKNGWVNPQTKRAKSLTNPRQKGALPLFFSSKLCRMSKIIPPYSLYTIIYIYIFF